MRGAWAGEIGHTQFLPKEYNETAVDFDGDGHRNLKRSIPDAMASSAALLVKHGWQANQPWLQEVRVPDDMPWDQADIAIQHPRAQWAKWGVKASSRPTSSRPHCCCRWARTARPFWPMAILPPYLLWNESLVYSTTAAYLATRIAGAGKLYAGNAKVHALSYKQIIELQNILVGKGYDVGEVDGKMGRATRAAVKDVQIKTGWPADSYPTVEFLQKLKQG